MAKSFKTVPKKRTPSPEQIEAFVTGGTGTDQKADEPVKRVSIDVPESLHTRFKVACAKAKSKMAPEIIAFIERRVTELENETS
ncbi:MAG: plasmid partition protein ParG [Ahrensia sp.]|nr:plasmid partition protein ParG [Ahrensia sp.]